jgi:hypothetical protein
MNCIAAQAAGHGPGREHGTTGGMIRFLIKAVLVLAILGAIALAVFAYVGPVLFPQDFAPQAQEIRQPVTLGAP